MNKESVIKKYNLGWTNDPLNYFRTYERNLVLPEIFDRPEKILDLACGDGAVSEYLAKKGFSVTSIDISNVALEKLKNRKLNNYIVCGDVEEPLCFKSENFDSVFWGDNIEHLFEPMKTLQEIWRILKKGGRVIISCPNTAYWRYRYKYSKSGTVPLGEGRFYEHWESEHIRFFNFKILKRMLAMANFEVIKLFGTNHRNWEHKLAKKFPNIFGKIIVVVARKSQ